MRQKRSSMASEGGSGKNSPGKNSPRRVPMRLYAAFFAAVFGYIIFRFLTLAGGAVAWGPKQLANGTRQACWHSDLNATAGAAPCHDFGVPTPEGNAKVALMFLVRHNIPTEPIWTAFIASAAELTLKRSVPPTAPAPPELLPSSRNDTGPTPTCETYIPPIRSPEPFADVPMQPITNTTRWIQQTLNTPLTPRQLYERQDLFSIYVHRTPGFEERQASSIFYGREIDERMTAAISQPSLVAAHKALLRAALKDPRNTMFILVSEVCVPLHHPALMWSQLMSEAHVSRVSAITEDMQRWWWGMEYGSLQREKFLKSSQWVGLTRMHAMIVAEDDHVWPRFDKFCRTGVKCGPDLDFTGGSCIADEHFVATLLAVYDQHAESTIAPWERNYERSLASTRSLFQHTPLPYTSRSFWSFSRSLLHSTQQAQHEPSSLDYSLRETVEQLDSSDWTWDSREGEIDDTGDWQQQPGTSDASQHAWDAGVDSSSAREGFRRQLVEADSPGPSQLTPLPVIAGAVPTSSEIFAMQLAKGAALKERLRQRRRQNDPNAPPLLRGVSDSRRRRREIVTSARKIKRIEDAMRENLAREKWLARFRPLSMDCPLLGRRVSIDAVSEWSSKAFDCDGLGFAWKCIRQSRN